MTQRGDGLHLPGALPYGDLGALVMSYDRMTGPDRIRQMVSRFIARDVRVSREPIGGRWLMVMPRSNSASIAYQTRSVRLRCSASGLRCRSCRPERESDHSITVRTRLLDSSGAAVIAGK